MMGNALIALAEAGGLRAPRQKPGEPHQSEGIFLTLIQRFPGRSLRRRDGAKSPVGLLREGDYSLAEWREVIGLWHGNYSLLGAPRFGLPRNLGLRPGTEVQHAVS
jgi:hypothetical protein